MPVEVVRAKRMQHRWREICRGQQETWIRGETGHRRFAVTDYNCAATFCCGEEQLGEIVRETHTTMAGGIPGKLSGVHGDAGPGESLHIRHGRVLVFFRAIG